MQSSSRKNPKLGKRLNDALRVIYADRDGSLPNLTRLERQDGSRLTRFLLRTLGILVLLSAASWAGFFLWSRGWFQTGDPLTIVIEGPAQARAGEEVFYTVRYANHGRVPLASLEMKLNLPSNFTVRTLTPQPTDATTNTWTIGSLHTDSDGAIVVSGIFHSEVIPSQGQDAPAPQTLQAFFTYKPANFSSEFQDIRTFSVAVDSSAATLTVTGPEKVMEGDDAVYVVNVQNTSSLALFPLRLALAIPPGFTVNFIDPKPTAPDQPKWDINKLGPGALWTLTMRGHYNASAADEQSMTADIGFMDGNALLRQATGSAKTHIIKGALALNLTINGSGKNQTADPGHTIRLSVSYGNNGTETVEGTKLTLTAQSTNGKPLPIDWAKADIGKAVHEGNTFTWDARTESGLGKLPPRANGVIDLLFPVLPHIDIMKMTDRLVFNLSATTAKIGSIASARAMETSPIAVGINSDFSLAAEGLYYTPEGEVVGTGPLPPRVGSTTSYRLVWTMTNSMHDLTGFSLSTILPNAVAWTGKANATAGTMTFDPATRFVTWKVDTLSRAAKSPSAFFTVSITPTMRDLGSFFKLTNAMTGEALDISTQEKLARSLPELTTELPNDPGARDKGVVVK